MAKHNQHKEVIFKALQGGSDSLVQRGFPQLPNKAKVYKDVRLGGYGGIDILAIGRSKQDDALEVNLYQLEDKIITSSSIHEMTDKLGGASQWLKRDCEESEHRVNGYLIGTDFEDFLSYYLGSYISCYTMNIDAIEGFNFYRYCHRAYSNVECEVDGIDIPPQQH